MEIFDEEGWNESKSQSEKIYSEKIEAVRRKLNELEEKGVQVLDNNIASFNNRHILCSGLENRAFKI